MAESDLQVTISGTALSVLFYENACIDGDQMGFLLGNVAMYVTKNVTDSVRHEETVKRRIDITGVLTCKSSGSMYDTTGKLHKEVLKNCIRERSKQVVGWFRFRHNNRLAPTFRDKILHKELAAYFSDCNSNVPTDYFLACILNAATSEKQNTHKFKHVLLRYHNRSYRPVPLRINNLGGGNDNTEAPDYIPTPTTDEHEGDFFTKFVKSLKLDVNRKSGSDLVMTLQKASEQYLESLVPKLCESDQEIYELEREVRDMRNSIVQRVLSPDPSEMRQSKELKHRVSMNSDGEQSVDMEIKHESMKGGGEHSVKKEGKHESPITSPKSFDGSVSVNTPGKGKSDGRSKNALIGGLNKRNNPNKSTVQKSASDSMSYSQAMKKSADSDDDTFIGDQ